MTQQTNLYESYIKQMKMPEEHREIWDYLLANQMRYPRANFIPPFKRPSKPDRNKRIAVAEFETVESEVFGFPRVIRLRIISREWQREVDCSGTDGVCEAIRSVLFSFRTRGYIIVFRFGNKADLRIFIQQFADELLASGFTCQPINAGNELIAIKMRKNSHSWTLCDFEKVTGLNPTEVAETCPFGKDAKCACIRCLELALDALYTIQNFLIHHFGTALRMTIGSASIRAASMSLPSELWKWKPHPLLVTMCRLGGGYRGGYISGRGYRGPSWLVDTNRMYTWALTCKLPKSSALSPSVIDGVLRDGIYVCTIIGTPTVPIYLSVWRGSSNGFSYEYWHGDTAYTVLTTAEIDGIRALGCTVTTGIGFQFTSTFTLQTYAEKLVEVTKLYGKYHPFSRIAKSMGNSVYGKFGERPERTDCIFSVDKPTADCFPFVDNSGTEIDNLWERKYVRYNAHQHVDIAATITGYARNQMYHAFAAIIAKGGRICATNTDSIITNISPKDILELDDNTIGKWRQVAFDPDGITVARNAYAIGEHIALSGAPRKNRNTIELMARHQEVVIRGIRKAPLSLTGPIFQEYSFSVGANSNTGDLDHFPMWSDQERHEMAVFLDEQREESPLLLAT